MSAARFFEQPKHAESRSTGRPKHHPADKPALARALPRHYDNQLGLRIAVEKEIALGDGRTLIFYDKVRCQYCRDGEGVLFKIPPFDARAGNSVEEARQAAAKAVWEEAEILLHTRTYTLDPATKKRKGVLMSLIDVVRSKIAKPLGDYAWVLGRIEDRGNGERIFREAGSEGKCFEFSPNLMNELPTDHFIRMGKVLANEVGLPAGPVVELGPQLDIPGRKEQVGLIMQGNEMGDLHDEHNRWLQYVASLDERIARGEMTASQCQAFRRIWDRARDIFPRLRYPSGGCTSEGRLHLGWSFADIPGKTFTIDIESDGSIEWFFRDTTLSVVLGTDDNSEYDITDETLNLLAPFQK